MFIDYWFNVFEKWNKDKVWHESYNRLEKIIGVIFVLAFLTFLVSGIDTIFNVDPKDYKNPAVIICLISLALSVIAMFISISLDKKRYERYIFQNKETFLTNCKDFHNTQRMANTKEQYQYIANKICEKKQELENKSTSLLNIIRILLGSVCASTFISIIPSITESYLGTDFSGEKLHFVINIAICVFCIVMISAIVVWYLYNKNVELVKKYTLFYNVTQVIIDLSDKLFKDHENDIVLTSASGIASASGATT